MDEIVDSIPSPTLLASEADSPWFDFLASLTNSLAWPIVVLVTVLVFRGQILSVFSNLRSLKFGDTELGFESGLKAVTETSKGVETPPKDAAVENDARLVELIDMAASSPTGAIVEAWKDIAAEARLLVERGMFRMPQSDVDMFHRDVKASNILNTSRLLKKYGLLPPTELATFEELRDLRNRAAHENDQRITVDQARQYVRIADKLVDVIKGLTNELQ